MDANSDSDIGRKSKSRSTTMAQLETALAKIQDLVEAQRESEERLNTLFNFAPEAVVMLDCETGRFLDVNPRAEQLFGLPRDELCKLGPFDLSPSQQPDGRDSSQFGEHMIKEGLAGAAPVFEWWHCNAKGDQFPCEVRLVRMPWGGRTVVRGSITEISERKHLELLEQERSQTLERIARGEPLNEVLHGLTEAIEDLLPGLLCSVLILDPDAGCLRHGAAPSLPDFYNEFVDGLPIGPQSGSCGAAAYSRQRIIVADVMQHPNWADFRELAAQAQIRACWSEPITLTGDVLGTFAMYYRAPHEPASMELKVIESAAQLAGIAIDHHRNKEAILNLNRSLEQRVAKRTEQLTMANRALAHSNDELKQFAYVASHDLQEPLRVVTSFGQLLQRNYRGKLDDKADEWIDFIVEGGRRMQQLIQDLLGYSRIESQARPFKRVELERVLEYALANLRASIDDTGASITHQELPTVLADEPQMIQVMQNLIGNAIKFHDSEPPIIRISATQDDGFWMISVQDNGIGIDPNHSERIFEFFTRLNDRQQFPGTGIGLPICQRVVQRHGGRIWLESSPGSGSTFFFTLPVESLP